MDVLSKTMIKLLEQMPDWFIWKFARRYIAGSTLQEAMKIRDTFHQKGILTTLDVLGEDTLDMQGVESAEQDYCALIENLKTSQYPGNISLKLSQFGLKFNPDGIAPRMESLVRKANESGIFVRIDMEDSSTTQETLDLYRYLRKRFASVGTVVQAYLKRSEKDIQNLQSEGFTHLRICKGIYREPASIAYQARQEIRNNYMRLIQLLMDGGSFVAIATHDEWLIEKCILEIRRRALSLDKYEFQMLHGVGEHLRPRIVKEGHPLRIYVPFGIAWKAYSFRRFKENPKLAWYIVKNMLISRGHN